MSPRFDPPTPRQLQYLRTLAARTATTFASPRTRGEARREIRRLEALPSLTRSERRHEHGILDSDRERLQPSSTIKPEEVTCSGSHARWAKR
jgi:hypothetical protein